MFSFWDTYIHRITWNFSGRQDGLAPLGQDQKLSQNFPDSKLNLSEAWIEFFQILTSIILQAIT